jgi:hypothetical protein
MVRSQLMQTQEKQGARGWVRLKTGKAPEKGLKTDKCATKTRRIQAKPMSFSHCEKYRLATAFF